MKRMSILTKEEKEKRAMEALEKLAFGGIEQKVVTQYQRGANGRDVVKGKNITEVNKLPDRSALFKWMEINNVYVDAQVMLKRSQVAQTEEEQADKEQIEEWDLNE